MSIKLQFDAEGRKAVRETKHMKDATEREIKDLRRTTEVQGEKMERQWGEVNRKIKGLSPSLKAVGIAATAMAATAVYAVGRFAKASLDAFGKQELAEKKLEAALGKVNQGLLDHASALQQVTMYGDEATLEAMAMLGAFIKDEEQLKRATTATLDLAAAKGMDLVAAADLVGKSIGSSTNALTRYGIEVTGAVGSTERLDTAVANITKLFGGQAVAQTQTYEGAMAQLNNQWGDFMEVVGEQIAPILIDVVIPRLSGVIDKMSTWVEQNDELIRQDIAGIFSGIGQSFEMISATIGVISDGLDMIGVAGALLTGNYEQARIEFERILGIQTEFTPGLDYTVQRTGELKGFWEGIAEVLPEYSDQVTAIKSSTGEIAEDTKKTYANVKGLDKTHAHLTPRVGQIKAHYVEIKKSSKKIEDHTKEWELSAGGVVNAFRDADNFGKRLLESLIKAVVQTQILSKFKMGGGGFFSSFLGFLFHEGGSPWGLPQIPARAPYGSQRYHDGGMPLGKNERSIVVDIREGILNQLGMNTIGGRRGLAAANMGIPPGGGSGNIKVTVQIDTIIGDEEYVLENVIPYINKAARDLGREVWASDTRRAQRVGS